jgi:hypothetical protein
VASTTGPEGASATDAIPIALAPDEDSKPQPIQAGHWYRTDPRFTPVARFRTARPWLAGERNDGSFHLADPGHDGEDIEVGFGAVPGARGLARSLQHQPGFATLSVGRTTVGDRPALVVLGRALKAFAFPDDVEQLSTYQVSKDSRAELLAWNAGGKTWAAFISTDQPTAFASFRPVAEQMVRTFVISSS